MMLLVYNLTKDQKRRINMRKAIALFLPLTLLISTASCSQKNDSPDTPSVSSTEATTETASEQTEETATEETNTEAEAPAEEK